MSFLSYNGVTLPYALTRVHQIGPVMDPSGSDELYMKIRLEAEAVLNADFRGIVASPAVPLLNGDQMLRYIRHLLCQPRKPLYYDPTQGMAGSTTATFMLVNVPTGRDDAGGPFPDANAIEVTYTTEETILIKFAVETYRRECDVTSDTQPTWSTPVSIRWEEAISFTEQFQAILTRTGTAILTSRSAISMDTVRRNWVTPGIPAGFGRRQADYQMSRDGLRCDFTFVDEQLQFAPPMPATDMQLVQSEETTPTGVGLRNGTISCVVTGAIGADPKALQYIAAQVVAFRLRRSAPLATGARAFVIGATKFVTTETRNSVSVALLRTYKTGMRPVTAGLFATRVDLPGGGSVPSAIPGGAIGIALAGVAGAGVLPNAFEWVGAGTTRRTGYETWASPSPIAPVGTVGTNPDGIGLARAVGFFAALLRDPCGRTTRTTPYAPPSTIRGATGTGDGGFGGLLFSAVVDVVAGGATSRSGPVAAGFFGGVGGVLGAAITVGAAAGAAPGEGSGSAAEFQADATSAPTTRALLTAALSAYASSDVPDNPAVANPLVAADPAPGVYSLWQCYNEFDTDQGNVVVPVCNPLAPSVQIKHSGDVLVFRKKWTATKIGSPPVLPAVDQGSNLVLVRKYVGLPNVNVTANGTDFEYRIDGVYEYRALDPTDVRLLSDTPPFLAPTWAAKITDWATDPVPRLLADDGNSSLYAAGSIQPPAGVYDFPVSPYVNAIGTGLLNPGGGSTGGPGNTPQPGGSQPTGGGQGGGGPLGAGGTTSFTTGVGLGGRSSPTAGTPVFGGTTGSGTGGGGPLGGTPGGESVIPAPPTQPEPTGGN